MESTSPPLTFKISSAKTKTTPQLWSLRAILGSLEPNDEPASRTASPEPVQQDGINIATPHLQNQFCKDENHPSPSKSVLQRRKPPLTFKFSSAKTKTTPQLWSLRTILGSLEPNDEPASRTASPEPVQQDGINIATPRLQNQFCEDENHHDGLWTRGEALTGGGRYAEDVGFWAVPRAALYDILKGFSCLLNKCSQAAAGRGRSFQGFAI
ncbi:hypothetical protein V8E51_007532 [Hyaloscypha variabilis]